jgi:hypothetical protein
LTMTELEKYKAALEKIVKVSEYDVEDDANGWYNIDEDWNPNDQYGGNMDDAYYGGEKSGRIEMGRIAFNALNK